MKKFLIGSIMVTISGTSFANGAVLDGYYSNQQYFHGGYIGIGAGAAHLKPKLEHDYDLKLTNDNVIIPNKSFVSNDGDFLFNGNIFAGYGLSFKTHYYFGGELFANIFSGDIKTHHVYNFMSEGNLTPKQIVDHFDSKVKMPYSFGADLRTGYLISPKIMIYVLFGLDYAKIKATGTLQNNNGILDFSTTPYVMNNDINKWTLGYMPGLGVEASLSKHVSLRMQYTYTYYHSIQDTVHFKSENANKALSTGQSSIRIKPRRNMFTLTWSYLLN